MELQIKQLKQGSNLIIPQTTAEAVLVKQNNNVIRLDQALLLKSGIIITSKDSGLTSYVQNDNVIITHSNKITPQESLTPCMIKYDSNGHITESLIICPIHIKINEIDYLSHTGSKESVLLFGDDFTTDNNNNVKLNWKNI